MFANVYVLVCFASFLLLLALVSAGTLSRVKTFLRTATGQDRLTSLSLLAVYREHEFDLEDFVDQFASSPPS